MIYPNGKAETTPKGMANVFREFYEDLYAAKGAPTTTERSKPTHKTKQQAKLPRVTIKEIDKALKELKNGKCKDTKHVTAEIIKHAGIKAKKRSRTSAPTSSEEAMSQIPGARIPSMSYIKEGQRTMRRITDPFVFLTYPTRCWRG